MKFIQPFYFLACLFLMVACKHPDEHQPVIDYIHANGSNSVTLTGDAGAANTFEIGASDNEGLSQMKIQFYTQTGIHSHVHSEEGIHEAFFEFNQGEWDTLHISNISGKQLEKQLTLPVPATINGGWRMVVTVMDTQGNLASDERIAHFENGNLPGISVGTISPAADEEGIIRLAVGDAIVLEGIVADVDSLAYISAEISNNENIHWTNEWNEIGDWTFQLNQLISPAFTEAGNYYYIISARDADGWENTVRAEVIVE